MTIDLILLGAPGAGKGTQAQRLKGWLSVPQVSTGDLFREAISHGTELGRQAQAYMDRGALVPDAITIRMVEERLAQPDCAHGVILDGFPRTQEQARALDDLLAAMGRQVDLVLNLVVSEETLIERLAGRWTCSRCGRVYHRLFSPEKVRGVCDVCGGKLAQREDDTPETQRRRIQVYREQTAPLIRYYRSKGVLVDVDGEQDADAVDAQIRGAIAPLASRKA